MMTKKCKSIACMACLTMKVAMSMTRSVKTPANIMVSITISILRSTLGTIIAKINIIALANATSLSSPTMQLGRRNMESRLSRTLLSMLLGPVKKRRRKNPFLLLRQRLLNTNHPRSLFLQNPNLSSKQRPLTLNMASKKNQRT